MQPLVDDFSMEIGYRYGSPAVIGGPGGGSPLWEHPRESNGRPGSQYEAGQLAAARLKEIEDRAVDQAIAVQEAAGLDVVSDGELRRHTFIDQLTEAVHGLTPDPAAGHIPVPFHDQTGEAKTVFSLPVSVTEKLRRRRMMTVEEYSYARGTARRAT